uniref:G-protein coupled receptors family 1 profile domain-containing protein n=1 Tax=Malurus cyaneus samueli TaxID=2593467 RepID=A0A8C5T3U9_9PASS
IEEMSNSSSISHFLLLPLADTRQLQLLHLCLLLGISLAALLANGLIISAVACGHHLHSPMFFFLLNLALTDLGSICTTVPKAMHNSLWDTRDISYDEFAAQVFFFLLFISAEYFILTVMCYDHYVSICKPLHYGTLLGSRACAHMAAAAWASAFLYALMHTANTFSLPLCQGNALGQFFCEIPHILKLSCSKSYLRELGLIVVSAFLLFGCFVFIVFSYVQIFRALSHLTVVSLFISTSFFTYLKPLSMSSPSLDLVLSVLYSVVPPALNPLIYSLRNQELKDEPRLNKFLGSLPHWQKQRHF